MKRTMAGRIGAAWVVADACVLLGGCLADPGTEAPTQPGLCSESVTDPAALARRQPYIKGWDVPERVESGAPLRFSATVSDTCGLIRERRWVFGSDTVAADDSNRATYAFPSLVDDSFPVAFVMRDAQGNVREQRASLSVGSWIYRSDSKYRGSARFLAESAGQYVYLAAVEEYPHFYPVLLYLSRAGKLAKEIQVAERDFDIASVLDNGDGTFTAAGGLDSSRGSPSYTTSSPHAAVLGLDGSVIRDIDISAGYGYTSVAQILRAGDGYLLALNQELPYESGTAVGSNYCPTVNLYLKFGPDWKEAGRRRDSTFACGMVSKALPDGKGGMLVMGYERTDAPGIARSFLAGIGPDLAMTILDTARDEAWSDVQRIGGLYYILGASVPSAGAAASVGFLRTFDPISGARDRIPFETDGAQPSRLLYSDQTLFVAGVVPRYGYQEPDDFFVYRMDLQGRIQRRYVNRIGDGAFGCDLARAGNHSLLASLLLYQPQTIVNGLVVVNLDAEGRGVEK